MLWHGARDRCGCAEEEVVVLSKVLAADTNFGFQSLSAQRLEEFNGKPVGNLRELKRLIDEAAATAEEYLIFDFEELQVVLDAEECRRTEGEILKMHMVPRPCSEDLL